MPHRLRAWRFTDGYGDCHATGPPVRIPALPLASVRLNRKFQPSTSSMPKLHLFRKPEGESIRHLKEALRLIRQHDSARRHDAVDQETSGSAEPTCCSLDDARSRSALRSHGITRRRVGGPCSSQLPIHEQHFRCCCDIQCRGTSFSIYLQLWNNSIRGINGWLLTPASLMPITSRSAIVAMRHARDLT
jgi:hypothetical protein